MKSSPGKLMENIQHVSVFQVRRRIGDSITARFQSWALFRTSQIYYPSTHSSFSNRNRLIIVVPALLSDVTEKTLFEGNKIVKSINSHAEVYRTAQTPSNAIVYMCTTPLLQHHHIIPLIIQASYVYNQSVKPKNTPPSAASVPMTLFSPTACTRPALDFFVAVALAALPVAVPEPPDVAVPVWPAR